MNALLDAKVDRDSVCAGDDCESHEASFKASPTQDIMAFLEAAMRSSPLAGIAGGNATWLIDIAGYGKGCIGVMAQQWSSPQLLIPEQTMVGDLFGTEKPAVHFRYWCQANPEAVLEALKSGNVLPSRYLE